MGSQRTISKYNLEYYLPNMVTGKFDMPVLAPTVYKPKSLAGFNQLKTADWRVPPELEINSGGILYDQN